MCKKLLVLSCLISSVALAENTVKLPESNVKSDYIEINRLKPTKNIIVIEGKDIHNKGYQNFEEVLDDIPSINVGKTGWGEIDIRGQGEDSATKNLQVMLDGAPITTLVNHPMQTNYNVVPVENIEKIEIIPGGGSIIYGTGSVGGVINITTNLKNLQKTKKDVGINIGSNQKDYMINLGHNFNDKFSAQASFTKLDRDLYFKDTYRDTNYFSAGLNYKIKDNQNLSLRYSNLNEDGQFIKQLNYETLKKVDKDYVPKERKLTVGLDKDKHKIEKIVSGYLKADREINSYNLTYTGNFNSTKLNTDIFYNKGYFSNTYDGLVMNTKTRGIKNKLDYSYGKNTIFEGSSVLFGFDYFKQSANLAYNDYRTLNWKNKTYSIRPLSFEYDKKTVAFYFLNNLKYKDFDFSQGLRRDLTYWGFDKVAAKNEGSDVSKRFNTNYELALAYNYRDTGKIYARYERSFTSPDGLQITDDFSKQDIMPTKGKDTIYDIYEIGLRDKIGFSTVVLTAFMNKTDNEMTRNYVMDKKLGFGRKSINILKAKRKGIELALSQKIGNLSLEESYAYLKGKREYNSSAKDFVKKYSWIDWTKSGLKKVPKHALTLKANYDFNDNYSAHIKYKYLGKYSNFIDEKDLKGRTALKPEEAFIKSYSTVDVGMNYKNENGISVSAGINNLFDKKYFEYVGERIYSVCPAEGRTWYMGMKYTF